MAAKVISFLSRIRSRQTRIELLPSGHRRPLRLSAAQRFSPTPDNGDAEDRPKFGTGQRASRQFRMERDKRCKDGKNNH